MMVGETHANGSRGRTQHSMALDQSALLEVLEALKAAEVDDRIRQAAQTIYQALIEAELSSVIGALPCQRTDARTAQRNGTGRGRSPPRRETWSCGFPGCGPDRSSRPCSSGAAGWISHCSRPFTVTGHIVETAPLWPRRHRGGQGFRFPALPRPAAASSREPPVPGLPCRTQCAPAARNRPRRPPVPAPVLRRPGPGTDRAGHPRVPWPAATRSGWPAGDRQGCPPRPADPGGLPHWLPACAAAPAVLRHPPQ